MENECLNTPESEYEIDERWLEAFVEAMIANETIATEVKKSLESHARRIRKDVLKLIDKWQLTLRKHMNEEQIILKELETDSDVYPDVYNELNKNVEFCRTQISFLDVMKRKMNMLNSDIVVNKFIIIELFQKKGDYSYPSYIFTWEYNCIVDTILSLCTIDDFKPQPEKYGYGSQEKIKKRIENTVNNIPTTISDTYCEYVYHANLYKCANKIYKKMIAESQTQPG